MKTEKKQNKVWTLLAPVVVLVAICLVVTAALAFTNQATAPIIEAANAAKAQAALLVVLPEGADFQVMEGLEGLPETITEVQQTGNGAGYVVSVTGTGYGGNMNIMVGLSADGKITGTRVLTHSETEGQGSKVVNDNSPYQQQLIGMSDTNGIQATAGATVSSGGMRKALQDVFDAYVIITGGTVEPKLVEKPPRGFGEKTLEKYYPGAAFTEVLGGQVSDAGVVVYGEAQGYESNVRVAVFFDPDGNILGILADTGNETEYKGQDVDSNAAFIDAFKGATDIGAIDGVSGSTMTSNAVKSAVKLAIANYDTVKGAA